MNKSSLVKNSEFVLDEVKCIYYHNNKRKQISIYIIFKKMVLIGLLQRDFLDNLKTQKFPSHVIIVRKEDLKNIKDIECFYLKGVNLSASQTMHLSNLEKLSKFILFLYNISC